MSATVRHRQNRSNSGDKAVFANPSTISIPIAITEAYSEKVEGANDDQDQKYVKDKEEVESPVQSSGGFSGKFFMFVAGGSGGLALAELFGRI